MTNAIALAFRPANDSISWANEAIGELQNGLVRFFQSNITSVVTELNPKTGEHVQKVRLTQALPQVFRRKTTEALINTRHAFDQAAFAARRVTTRGNLGRSNYYPWAKNPIDLDFLLQRRGFDERLWDVFKSHDPYPRGDTHSGGDNLVRTLAVMANDKHTVGLSIDAQISSAGYPDIRGKGIQSMSVLAPRWDPVKNEAELIRWIGDVQVNGNYRFSFQVLFKDAGLTEPVNVVSGLHAFVSKAKIVVETLQARCMEIGISPHDLPP